METLGKYKLLRRIAVGGMAEIFLAEYPGPAGFSRRVAIKRILPHRADDAEFIEMFLNEARLAAMLQHPNIVQIYDLGEINQTYFLSMEFVEGYDLGQILDQIEAKKEKTPPLYAAHLIGQAAIGLHHAHHFIDPQTQQPLGLIHRDISLPNIMVSNEGIVKVLDFGIAKAASASDRKPTQTGILKGKISYMSPEYLMGDPIDWRHDLFALGVVLYELMTAEKPFRAKGDVQMLQAILTQEPMNPLQFNPNIPAPLLPIMMRLLAKDPDERYQHGLELEGDIRRCVQQCAGGEITQFFVSEFLRTLFSDQPTVIPEPMKAPLPRVPQMTTQAPGIRKTSPTSNAPAYRPDAPSPTGQFTPPLPQTGRHVPPSHTGRHTGRHAPPPSTGSARGEWMEETRALDLNQLNASGAIVLPDKPPHFADPTPTSALQLQPHQDLQSMSMEEISQLQPQQAQQQPPPSPPPESAEPSTPPLATPPPPPPALPSWLYVALPILVVLLLILVIALWRIRAQRKAATSQPVLAKQLPEPPPTPRLLERTPQPPLQRIPQPPLDRTPPHRENNPAADAGSPPALPDTTHLSRPTPPILPDTPPAPQIEIGEAQPPPDIDLPPPANPLLQEGESTLIITASPPCPCDLYWMGQRFRVSLLPLRIPLDAGKHHMIVRKAKPYLRLPISVELQKGEKKRKHLRILEGYLALTVTPWSSKVYIDGLSYGTTPLRPIRLYQGFHTLRIDNSERLNRPITKSIYIHPGKQLPVRIKIP